MKYQDGYKYQLTEDEKIQTALRPPRVIQTRFIRLDTKGLLTLYAGYAWDGASGIFTINTKTFRRGSAGHDAIYQLLRLGLLPAGQGYRKQGDQALRVIVLEDGMIRLRAAYVYKAVRKFGTRAASPKYQKPVLFAP